MTSAANAWSRILSNGATRPSCGSLGFPLRTGAGFSQNLTGIFCRWHFRLVTTASDPVLEANKRRECQLDAACLTLRGTNNQRAFMTLGPGGVGQSLNTALVADVFGVVHGFIDVNVFYTEDGLSKQADTFTGQGADVSTL